MAVLATPYMHLFPPVWCAYLATTLHPGYTHHPARRWLHAQLPGTPRTTGLGLIYVRALGHMHWARHLGHYTRPSTPADWHPRVTTLCHADAPAESVLRGVFKEVLALVLY